MIEDSLNYHRETAQQLQKRLSIRHQECRLLRKELFRAQEAARIANEVADHVERDLEDLGAAYDALRDSHIQQTARINELESLTLRQFLRGWWARLWLNSLTNESEYYGLLAKR